MPRRSLTLAVLALAFCPAVAAANPATFAESIQIARQALPADHPCKQTFDVVYDATLTGRGIDGLADGALAWDGVFWALTGCTVAIAPGLDALEQCYVIRHEAEHLVRGPGHDGWPPLAPDECAGGTQRQQLIADIRASLPTPRGDWRVSCTPSGPRMRCRADSPRAVRTRRFTASVGRSTYGWSG